MQYLLRLASFFYKEENEHAYGAGFPKLSQNEKAAASSPETKAEAEWGWGGHFRKPYILLAPSLCNTKTLSVRTDNHEGDTSRELQG